MSESWQDRDPNNEEDEDDVDENVRNPLTPEGRLSSSTAISGSEGCHSVPDSGFGFNVRDNTRGGQKRCQNCS